MLAPPTTTTTTTKTRLSRRSMAPVTEWSPTHIASLIELVRERDVIWRGVAYRNSGALREAAWAEIAVAYAALFQTSIFTGRRQLLARASQSSFCSSKIKQKMARLTKSVSTLTSDRKICRFGALAILRKNALPRASAWRQRGERCDDCRLDRKVRVCFALFASVKSRAACLFSSNGCSMVLSDVWKQLVSVQSAANALHSSTAQFTTEDLLAAAVAATATTNVASTSITTPINRSRPQPPSTKTTIKRCGGHTTTGVDNELGATNAKRSPCELMAESLGSMVSAAFTCVGGGDAAAFARFCGLFFFSSPKFCKLIAHNKKTTFLGNFTISTSTKVFNLKPKFCAPSIILSDRSFSSKQTIVLSQDSLFAPHKLNCTSSREDATCA